MTFTHLSQTDNFSTELHHPTWQKILTWLKHNAAACPDGEHEINGRNIFAIASTIETMPLEQAVFESHRKYIDLHYCITGGEKIGYSPILDLKPNTKYNSEEDYLLYEQAQPKQLLTMIPDSFAIFMPEDGHMPKINDGLNKTVRKIVVKIHLDAVAKT